MNTIVVIQNTEYHFETVLSLYQILKKIGLNAQVYRCLNVKNKFDQINFLQKYNVETIELSDVNSDVIGIIVSAYPNPQVGIKNAIPNITDPIFSIVKKNLYISHRFKNTSDYNGLINSSNALCLSPLSERISIDYLYLTDIPLSPIHSFSHKDIRLTIQGHFELSGRNISLFKDIIDIIALEIKDKKITINILGTNTNSAIKCLQNINTTNLDIKLYDSLNEDNFYDIINNKTDWLLPLITPELKNSTYSLERYSSNFNIATSLRKPIFCHEYFKNIYNIPGIYFNETNLKESLINCLTIDSNKYNNLLQEFTTLIIKLSHHNKTTLMKKISQFN